MLNYSGSLSNSEPQSVHPFALFDYGTVYTNEKAIVLSRIFASFDEFLYLVV